LGKTINDGEFIRTGSLNKPPPVLLSTLSAIRANYEAADEKLGQIISSAFYRNPNLSREFAYPGIQHDILFDASCCHARTSSGDCYSCDKRWLIHRQPRHSPQPKVHYGIIASGNQVIKDGKTRDQLSEKLRGVLCFEMEAAGLMDNFPCLVIRGISDYADSHKTDRWQRYAALTAAAYAKEFLLYVPKADVERSISAPQMLAAAYRGLPTPQPYILNPPAGVGTVGGLMGHPMGRANASSSSNVNVSNIVHQTPSTHVREVYMQTPVAMPYQTPPPMAYAPQGRSKHKHSTPLPHGPSGARQWSGSSGELARPVRPTSIPRKAVQPRQTHFDGYGLAHGSEPFRNSHSGHSPYEPYAARQRPGSNRALEPSIELPYIDPPAADVIDESSDSGNGEEPSEPEDDQASRESSPKMTASQPWNNYDNGT
jgi:hypothetical protein